MNIADEGTSAHLQASVDKASTVASMNPKTATQYVNKAFERWGLPQNIKIDNGYPFVNPNHRNVPTLAKLWWIGLGINVIQNTPRCPQQNGIVECLQGTICSWSNPSQYDTIEDWQKRIDKESDFQRNEYQMPAKKNKTRIELYPELETNPRKYDPEEFDIRLVYEFLSNQVWKRRVKKNGEVNIFSQNIYIGKNKNYVQHDVEITFDPQDIKWIIRKKDGTLLKQSSKGVPNEKRIKEFAVMSKNDDTT